MDILFEKYKNILSIKSDEVGRVNLIRLSERKAQMLKGFLN